MNHGICVSYVIHSKTYLFQNVKILFDRLKDITEKLYYYDTQNAYLIIL